MSGTGDEESVRRLATAEVRAWLALLRDRLTPSQRDRLDGLAGLIGPDGRIVLRRAYDVVVSSDSKDPAAAWRQFTRVVRQAVAPSAGDAGDQPRFTLVTDTGRGDLAARRAWFDGIAPPQVLPNPTPRQDSLLVQQVETFAAGQIKEVLGRQIRGVEPVSPAATRPRRVHLLTDAHDQATSDLQRDFVNRLTARLRRAARPQVEVTSDLDAMAGAGLVGQAPGEDGVQVTSDLDVDVGFDEREVERRRRDEADVLVELVGLSPNAGGPLSPDRAGSSWLIAFSDPVRRRRNADQRLLSPPGQVYSQMNKDERETFLRHVVARLAGESGGLTPDEVASAQLAQAEARLPLESVRARRDGRTWSDREPADAGSEEPGARVARPGEGRQPGSEVPPQACPMEWSVVDIGEGHVPGWREEAIPLLLQWLRQGSTRFAVLLGDLGMGKTTTSRLFARAVLRERQGNPACDLPSPLYVDLRDITVKQGRPAGTLADLLGEAFAKVREAPSGAELERYVKVGRCLVIWDGLDEILVKLSAEEQRRFIEVLLEGVPVVESDALVGPAGTGGAPGVRGVGEPVGGNSSAPVVPDGRAARAGRVLMTCRTHFFTTVSDEAAKLTGQGRKGVGKDDFSVFIQAPFDDDQVRTYIERNLRGKRDAHAVEGAIQLIGQVHNLGELSTRPLTLSWIVAQIPEIEQRRAGGEETLAFDLYRGYTEDWVSRDDYKHQLVPAHKRRLMEALAWRMWADGGDPWPAERLDSWLTAFLEAHADLAAEYRPLGAAAAASGATPGALAWEGFDPVAQRDRLKNDLRNATFVSRQDADDRFAFAHTSFREFFLACYLAAALTADHAVADAAWGITDPGRETLDFLGQALRRQTARERSRSLDRLEDLKATGLPATRELVFRYGLLAHRLDHPHHALAGSRLDGLSLSDLTVRDVDLRQSSWRGAGLARVSFGPGTDLTGADFREVQMTAWWERHFLDRCSAPGVDWSGVDWSGAGPDDVVAMVDSDLTGSCWGKSARQWVWATGCRGVSLDTKNGPKTFEIPPQALAGLPAFETVRDGLVQRSLAAGTVFSLGGHAWRYLGPDPLTGRPLVIAEYLVGRRQYHDDWPASWAECRLRSWLNGEFFEGLPEEFRGLLAETVVHTDDNPRFDIPGGPDTEDRLYLLSLGEAEALWRKNRQRRAGRWADVTASANDPWVWWWLRSPGYYRNGAAAVAPSGALDAEGGSVVDTLGGVRPAFQFNL